MSPRQPPPQKDYFFERYPWNNQWVLFGIALAVSCFDFLSIQVLLFPILFVIPVALMAWNCGLRTALILGAVLSVIRFSIQCFAWGIPQPWHISLLNASVRLGMLFFITFLVGKLSQQTQALRARVRTLEGILPTCAFCKDIRDEAGDWHQIEDYVSNHTEARFSHGVCPTCAAEHYGDILKAAAQNQASSSKV